MGMFDHVRVSDPRFVCPDGHDLREVEFQTKEFACSMGHIYIAPDGVTSRDTYGLGDPLGGCQALTAKFEVYGFCEQCPAFVDKTVGNMSRLWCEFEVDVVRGKVQNVRRISESLDAFLASCKDEFGPMTHDEARAKQLEIWQERRK